MDRKLVFVLGTLLGLSQSLLWGGPQTQLTWSELGSVVDEKVTTVLPGGTHIEGKVLAVEPEGLRLRVAKTSDRNVMPKGERLVPRASVSVLRVTKHRVLARPLCALGAAGATAAIVLGGMSDVYEGALVIVRPAAAAGGAIGMGVAGYYIGKRLDRTVTEIRIVGENRQPTTPSQTPQAASTASARVGP
jgi:hypothetical protein